MSNFMLILCNCPDEESASLITSQLLAQQLVACVNRLPMIHSSYIWQGEINHTIEVQLQLKAPIRNFSAIEQAILALHPYDVPEIIAIELTQINQQYADWINEVTRV